MYFPYVYGKTIPSSQELILLVRLIGALLRLFRATQCALELQKWNGLYVSDDGDISLTCHIGVSCGMFLFVMMFYFVMVSHHVPLS